MHPSELQNADGSWQKHWCWIRGCVFVGRCGILMCWHFCTVRKQKWWTLVLLNQQSTLSRSLSCLWLTRLRSWIWKAPKGVFLKRGILWFVWNSSSYFEKARLHIRKEKLHMPSSQAVENWPFYFFSSSIYRCLVNILLLGPGHKYNEVGLSIWHIHLSLVSGYRQWGICF